MSIENQVKNKYFQWLYDYMCKGIISANISYKKLFNLLHDTEFDFYIRNDVNRARDGVDLRYRFAMDNRDATMSDKDIMDILDGPCSVLEMMIALAIRCEETIMSDTRYGDRTTQWFWDMLTNLGIRYMNDDRFSKDVATKKIYKFLERQYQPNGKGGLFYISNTTDDLTRVDIWTQLMWYLNNYA